jgi:poly(beta-D-mannuronate) lyase
MIAGKYWLLIGGMGLCLAAGLTLPRSAIEKANDCGIAAEPVISLDYGSRYKADSQTRSDLDENSNDAVNDALAPVDGFVQDLSRLANSAHIQSDPEKAAKAAACVFSAVHDWAKVDALSSLDSTNAKLSSPSRIGAIALAFAQITTLAPDNKEQREVIDGWLSRRAEDIISFFDSGAPAKASQNNLRAWASLAVGEVGILTGNQKFIDWSALSNQMIAGLASDDGSLPLEMARGKYALHYQLHAISALITSTARLCESGYDFDPNFLGRLEKIAAFSLSALNDPQIVESVTGNQQKDEQISAKKTSSIAWIENLSFLSGKDMLPAKFRKFRPLVNSKLGGNLTTLNAHRPSTCSARLLG